MSMKPFGLRLKIPASSAALNVVCLIFAIAASSLAQAPAKPPAPKPPPDVIVFTNGDQLTGTLERGVANSVVFKSDMAGEITVSLDKIKELHSSGSFAVLRKDIPVSRKTVTPGTVIYSDGKLTVAAPTGAPETVPEKQIGYIIDQPTYDKELEKKAGPFYARNRTTFHLQETYGKLTSPVIPQTTPPSPPAITLTSIFHSDAERDEYFSPKFYALGQTAFDHNYSQGLSLQQVYGGGIGWTAIKSTRQQLDLKATVQYEKQQYLASSGTPDQDLIGSTISESYHRNLPRKLIFTESISALPAWNVTNDYSANGSVALAMPLFKRLSLTISSTDNFLNDPAAGYNKNSFQFVTAASYSLK
jgi:hypothetical protein